MEETLMLQILVAKEQNLEPNVFDLVIEHASKVSGYTTKEILELINRLEEDRF